MKRVTVNKQANKIMRQWCIDNGVTRCEMCGSTFALTFAHRHKRRHYYSLPVQALSDRNQFLLLCLRCHEKIEYDKGMTDDLFLSKVGPDKY